MVHATVVRMEARSPEDLLRNLLAEDPRRLSNETRPAPGGGDLLLTARRDLIDIRESILAGTGRGELLAQVDWTLDMLENAMSER